MSFPRLPSLQPTRFNAPLPAGEFPGGGTDALPELHSDAMAEASVEDDVQNSGVFSDDCNLHIGDGVFSTSFALPGYAQRENGRGKSEVIDHQTKTPVEVYMAGSTRGQQYMPSTQPRWPSPDLDPFWDDGRRAVEASGDIPSVDTSFNPPEGAWDQNPLDGTFPENPTMLSVPVTGAPVSLPPRPIGALRSPAQLQFANLSLNGLGAHTYHPPGFGFEPPALRPRGGVSGLGSYYQSPVAGLGFIDAVTSLPTWQLALLAVGAGVVAKMLYKEFGGDF